MCFVVDDDAISRELTGKLVRSFGLEVETFAHGQDALAALISRCDALTETPGMATTQAGSPLLLPSAMCIDSNMPVLGGCETLQRLQTHTAKLVARGSSNAARHLKRLLIVGITGDSDAADRACFVAAGAAHALIKPLDPLRLANILRAVT